MAIRTLTGGAAQSGPVAPHTDKKTRESGTRVACRVKPNARETRIVAVHDDCVEVDLAAAPRDGAANAALAALLAKACRVPKTSARVTAGAKGRDKAVFLAGAEAEGVLAALHARADEA